MLAAVPAAAISASPMASASCRPAAAAAIATTIAITASVCGGMMWFVAVEVRLGLVEISPALDRQGRRGGGRCFAGDFGATLGSATTHLGTLFLKDCFA